MTDQVRIRQCDLIDQPIAVCAPNRFVRLKLQRVGAHVTIGQAEKAVVKGAEEQALDVDRAVLMALAGRPFLDGEVFEPAVVRALMMPNVVVPFGQREISRIPRKSLGDFAQLVQIGIELPSATLVLRDEAHETAGSSFVTYSAPFRTHRAPPPSSSRTASDAGRSCASILPRSSPGSWRRHSPRSTR